MHCSNCGATVPESSRFCTACGVPLSVADTSSPVAGVSPPPRAPVTPEPPHPSPPAGPRAPSPPVGLGLGQVPPAPPPLDGSRGPIPQDQGFFGALFDFSFARLVTPMLVKVLFVLAVIFDGIWALIVFVSAAQAGGVGVLIALVLAPLLFLLFVAWTRVILELVFSVIRIEEHTRLLAEHAQRDAR